MNYPVLAYKKDDSMLYAFLNEKDLKQTSRDLLKNKIFEGVFLVDSNGREFKITEVREVSASNIFGGYSLIRKGRGVIVDFELEQINTISLDTLKEFILSRIDKDPHSTLYESKNLISKAIDHKSLIALLR